MEWLLWGFETRAPTAGALDAGLMMSNQQMYAPSYANSHALVIGINAYRHAPPLRYARQDAEGVAALLVSSFAFRPENVITLLDDQASATAIQDEFLRFAHEDLVGPDDRLVVFYAGHGATKTGRRGEVGFLVPADGQVGQINSLVRWDALTRDSELVRAKHLLFIMDSCYGGLALVRSLPPGATRFAHDMLRRYARQVLTAGKGDEQVSDVGGPRAGHSVFTGHLLDALEGGAASPEGLISANSVMAYVYDRVARDYDSRQTPHYGFLDGDGDLLFNPELLEGVPKDELKGGDLSIQVSPSFASPVDVPETSSVTQLKEFLADPRARIRLDDYVVAQIRRAMHELRPERFPLDLTPIDASTFGERVRMYEDATSDLRTTVTLLSKWGSEEHLATLSLILARLAELPAAGGGYQVWYGLQWYPLLLLAYTGGIAALTVKNYHALATIITTPVFARTERDQRAPLIVPVANGMSEVEEAKGFKLVPGHERQYVPRSEYMFAALQPNLEDLLFLGGTYETHFDRFEAFWALVFADVARNGDWGPPGRFAWKFRSSGLEANPLGLLIAEATRVGDSWPPLRHGLFQGSLARFKEIANKYVELVGKFGWF